MVCKRQDYQCLPIYLLTTCDLCVILIQLKMQEKFRDRQPDNYRHYSEKGGHKARGDFWKSQRLAEHKHPGQAHRELNIIIRRGMFRDPQSGRK